MPAIVWRTVLAIVKSNLASHERRTGKSRAPTDADFSMAFGKAIRMAREHKPPLITATGIRLTKAGEKAEKAKLMDPENAGKEQEYRRLLGKRRLTTLLRQSVELRRTAGAKTRAATSRTSLDDLLAETAKLSETVGAGIERAVSRSRTKKRA